MDAAASEYPLKIGFVASIGLYGMSGASTGGGPLVALSLPIVAQQAALRLKECVQLPLKAEFRRVLHDEVREHFSSYMCGQPRLAPA